jgi:GTP-binding protein
VKIQIPKQSKTKYWELLLELEATEDQFNAPFVYASAKNGWANHSLDGSRSDMDDLFSVILDRVPAPKVEEGEFKMLISNIDWDDFVGRVAVGRILSGSVKVGDNIHLFRKDGSKKRVKITKIF